MKLTALLSELSDLTGLPGIHLDSSGACRLIFDDAQAIDLIQHPDDPEVLLLQVLLGTAPSGSGTAFQRRLLESNYLCGTAGRPVLSLIPATGEIVLWRSATLAALDVEALADLLATTARQAREMAAELDAQPEEPLSHPFSEPQLTGMIRV
jgi:hypothetical protein